MLLASSIPTLGGWEALLRLGIAAGLGAAVGIEREVRDREAGIRTHLLVSMGSALFTIVSAYGFHEFLASGASVVRADPTRIAAQIVTGIGFLGAGAIIREGLSVRGLTTAASLWVVAAIGMAAGAGYYWPAVAGAGLTLFALWPLRALAYRVIERVRPDERRIRVELQAEQSAGPLLDLLGDVRFLQVQDEHDRRLVIVDLRAPVDETLVARIADLDYVVGVQWRR
ncbi:MAG TPA: MgtC/SapB family protein [Caulobacteraceae bacterium]|nr:MgtC/SapB family protein [Caulobacteraceae bacterium]